MSHFSCSLKAVRQLCERQEELGQEEHVLLQDLSMWWSGGAVEHFGGHGVHHAHPPWGKGDGQSSTDGLALYQVVQVLKPFRKPTLMFCTDIGCPGQFIPCPPFMCWTLDSTLSQGSSLLLWTRALVMSCGQACRSSCIHSAETVYRLACLCNLHMNCSLVWQNAEVEEWRTNISTKISKMQGEM